MSKYVLAAQLYTLRDYCKTAPQLAKSLKKVAAIGYKAVQISGLGPIDPKEVAKIAKDNGLTIAATHMGWDSFLKDLGGVIDTHKLWDCNHPAIGGLPGEYFSLAGLKKFIRELKPVAAKLAAAGMDFSYHNHNHELARHGRKTWLEMLYGQTDGDTLKAEIDTYWIQAGGGDPAAWIKDCSGREPLLHLKDMTITGDRQMRFAEIGMGNLNWKRILKAAAKGGVEWYIVEQDECYERDPFDSLAISYRNLREMGLK